MGVSGLGKILLHEGLIGEKNLKIIEKTCHQAHAGIAKAVLTIGLLDEEELASLLVERTQFKRIPRYFQRQKAGRTDPSVYLPLPFIEFLEVYPYDIHNGRLDVVTLDPMDFGVIHQVEFFSGYPVRPHIASLSELIALIRTILPDFSPEEPNLQDFLIDYSVSSAQTLLHVGPALVEPPPPLEHEPFAPLAPPPEPEYDLGHEEDSAEAVSTITSEDLPAPTLEDGVVHHEEVGEPEAPKDLSQDVMDIFDEDAADADVSPAAEVAAEPEQEAEQEATTEPEQEATAEPEQEATAEPEQEATAEPEQEATAEPEQEAELAPELEPELEPEMEPESAAVELDEIPLDAPAVEKGEELELVEIAAEPALAAELVAGDKLAAEPDAEVAVSTDGLGDALAPLDVEDLPLEDADELAAEANDELPLAAAPEDEPPAELPDALPDASLEGNDLIDDITPEGAEDSIILKNDPPTPLEGAVRVLNEGLIKLTLGIGGEPDEAAIATLAKIAPEGKIVRIGASTEGGDGPDTEVIGWDADGAIQKTAADDKAVAEVIDLVATRGDNDALSEPEGWRTVAGAANTWQTTGYVDADGQSGLYLVAGIEDEFCTDEAFSHLSKEFLKLWHEKWAG